LFVSPTSSSRVNTIYPV